MFGVLVILALLSESARNHIDDVLKIAGVATVILLPLGRWAHNRQTAMNARLDSIEARFGRVEVFLEIVVDELADQRPAIKQRLKDAGAGLGHRGPPGDPPTA